MIYQRFGRWWGMFSLVDLPLVNFLTLVTEFAAISLALSHMNIAPRVGVPLAAVALVVMVVSGSYRRWERVTVFLCLLDLAWVTTAIKVRPSFGEILRNTVVPGIPRGGVHLKPNVSGHRHRGHHVRALATVLSTELHRRQASAFLGCEMGPLGYVSRGGFHYRRRRRHDDCRERGQGCTASASSIPRRWANELHVFQERERETVRSAILLLMINAGVLGTTAISLSSAWAYGEVRGWPHSLEMPLRKAPGFYLTYVVCVGLAAPIVLIPGAPLELIILGVQVLAGIMLPSAIIFLQPSSSFSCC
jgi:Natural resistance-associated macrophage protein